MRALAAPRAFMRPSPVLPMACVVVIALCAAAMAGLVTATVMPDCRVVCVVRLSLTSRASVIFTSLATMATSPPGALTSLPVCV